MWTLIIVASALAQPDAPGYSTLHDPSEPVQMCVAVNNLTELGCMELQQVMQTGMEADDWAYPPLKIEATCVQRAALGCPR
jgi:hypothetical protein